MEVLMLKLTAVSSLAAAAALLATAADARTVSIPFSASNFPGQPTIDNTYFPLVPGTTFTYKGESPDGCEVVVTTRVVHDTAYEGATCTTDPSALVEDTLGLLRTG